MNFYIQTEEWVLSTNGCFIENWGRENHKKRFSVAESNSSNLSFTGSVSVPISGTTFIWNSCVDKRIHNLINNPTLLLVRLRRCWELSWAGAASSQFGSREETSAYILQSVERPHSTSNTTLKQYSEYIEHFIISSSNHAHSQNLSVSIKSN